MYTKNGYCYTVDAIIDLHACTENKYSNTCTIQECMHPNKQYKNIAFINNVFHCTFPLLCSSAFLFSGSIPLLVGL